MVGGAGSEQTAKVHIENLTYNASTNTLSSEFFEGTATKAKYADLAEKYTSDADYEPGTVLSIGGPYEMTVCTEKQSLNLGGVVTTNPGCIMNNELTGKHVVTVALRGRVPCKVVGPVNKGDILVSSDLAGHAEVCNDPDLLNPLLIVGRALGHKPGDEPGKVEILV